MKTRLLPAFLFFLVACVTSAGAAVRPAGIHGIGPRLGLTINPDQFHFGGQLDLGDLAPRLMMMPNVEIGIGDNLTTFAPSFEVDYRFRSEWGRVWTPYLGGGVGPVIYSYSNSYGPGHHASNTDLGLYVQAGVGKHIGGPGSFFMEFKLGLADAPDAKFTVGWTFGS